MGQNKEAQMYKLTQDELLAIQRDLNLWVEQLDNGDVVANQDKDATYGWVPVAEDTISAILAESTNN